MMSFRERNPYTIGAVGLTVIVLAVLAAFFSDDLPIIGGGTTYSAYFTEAAGLVPNDDVAIAGVTVGKVTSVSLAGNQVRVTFKVKDTWLGDQSTAAIEIKTVLGSKGLSIDPQGSRPLSPDTPIPVSRTTSPYDVMEAFGGLSQTVDQLNTQQLAQSFGTLSQTFANTPADVRGALDGLSALSRTISSRDAQLSELLANTGQLSQTVADRDAQVQRLIDDGDLLLGMLQERESAISALLTGTTNLANELSGLVNDNQKQLAPVLAELNQFTTLLKDNQKSLAQGIQLLAPFVRVFTNAVGNGRWFDSYICGLLPPSIGIINSQGCPA